MSNSPNKDSQKQDLPVGPRRTVVLVDAPQQWLRQPGDLVGAISALLVIALIVLFAIYTPTTTIAVESDVRTFSRDLLQTLVNIPINLAQGVVTYLVPIAIWLLLAIRKRWKTLITSILAGATALGFASFTTWITNKYWPELNLSVELPEQLTIQFAISIIPYASMVGAVLIVAGTIRGSRTIKTAWTLLLVVLFFAVLQGHQNLTEAAVMLLLGVSVGMFARWVSGSEPERDTGMELINLVRRSGIDVIELIRVDNIPQQQLQTWNIISTKPLSYTDDFAWAQLRKLAENRLPLHDAKGSKHGETAEKLLAKIELATQADAITDAPHIDAAQLYSQAREISTPAEEILISRNYLARDISGNYFHLLILDEDRRILGILETWWRRLRLRSDLRHNSTNQHRAAEQMALMLLQTERLGIAADKFAAMSDSQYSILVATAVRNTPSLKETKTTEISDEAVVQLWHKLGSAHQRGLSHGNIHSGTITYIDGKLELHSWYSGSAISPDVSRKIDLAQLAAALTETIGIERTVATMNKALGLEKILAIAPFLQRTVLPEESRNYFTGEKKKEFQGLRDALAQQVPESSNSEPVNLWRFSPKTIITAFIGVGAVIILLGSINFTDLSKALQQAQPTWMILAFICGLITYLGAGLTLKAYTPEKIGIIDSTLVQIAASVVTLVAPAGIGPAALNLRFLQKRGVSLSAGLATVSLVQLAQFVTTLLLLFILSFGSGELLHVELPTATISIALGTVVIIIALIILIPRLRNWIWNKLKPTISQIWPRMIWLATHPQRIALGVAGSVLMTAGFVACFGLCLYSFGYKLSIVTLALTFLLANSLGSAIPSPGGIGPVEATLTGGLVFAGVPYSVAFSAVILYRLFTFWGRVPLGWLALKATDKRGLI
ncbi:MAG: lysylphosphatidylglycerol synthase transmembrane domain-containing protein [Arcanobacterium sp.]|nr:lysylphosphatidylglycerol synthase transmembrane domain-containing protein [Arcanobacterium sp.]